VHPPHLVRVSSHHFLHPERSKTGPHGVVLVGDRCSEERHDPVAHHLIDCPLVPVDRLHGRLLWSRDAEDRVLAAANGGTVFLDEVAELATDAQAMLLRFLQTGEGRAVGATNTIRVDVRIIAATHRNLEAAVERNAFREDLYYRLRRVVLRVPSLRERRDDIELLVEHVRRQANARYELSVAGVTAEALDAWLGHSWPGNVRELEAVLEQAMIFQSAGWLKPKDLELPVGRSLARIQSAPQVARLGDPGDDRVRGVMRRQAALGIVARRGSVTSGQLADECEISGEQARREPAH